MLVCWSEASVSDSLCLDVSHRPEPRYYGSPRHTGLTYEPVLGCWVTYLVPETQAFSSYAFLPRTTMHGDQSPITTSSPQVGKIS